jgi:aspartate aminotransferase-like enzyme
MQSHPKLMIPGPVDVWDETLDALAEPVLPNFSPLFHPIYDETISLLRRVFQTENDIFIQTSPGSGAVEACVASLFMRDEKVAAISNGPFASRAIEILRAYGCDVLEIEAEWGKAGDPEHLRNTLRRNPDAAGVVVVANETGTAVRNPVRELAQVAHEYGMPIFVDAVSGMGGYDLPVDRWELDLVCTSSNKALEIPPGLGIISISPRAWEVIEAKKDRAYRGWYYNLSTWKRYRDMRPGAPVSPTTMATSLIVALRASLKRIVEQVTLEGHWARYAWAQHMIRTGLRNIGFEMLVCDDDASYTVTTFWKRDDMENEQELRDFMLQEYNYLISQSWGPLTGKVHRMGHMGKACTADYLIPCLLGIEDFVRRVKGAQVPVGASLIGLEETR